MNDAVNDTNGTNDAWGDDDLALLAEAHRGYETLSREMGRVIVGQTEILRLLLAAVFAEGHVLLVGVPGLAKTLLVKTLSRALGWDFKRIQFTPDMMPADIVGMELLQEGMGSVDAGGGVDAKPQAAGGSAGGNAGESVGGNAWGGRVMRFVRGPIFANLVLADEINRTPPKTQSALLEAMQEYTVTSMGQTHALAKPFVVIATQNPIEQEGTYPLPEAQLDRFMFSLSMAYPTRDEECAIVSATTGSDEVVVEAVFDAARMRDVQALVRRVPASAHVVDYAVRLARATRPSVGASGGVGGGDVRVGAFVDQYVAWGAGPRGGQHMILAAKALAVLDGEPAVGVHHVCEAARHVLVHRVLPNYQAMGEGIDAAAIVAHVIEQVGESDYV